MEEDSEGKVLYSGSCFGGPLNSTEAVSRFPKGFLLVDKARNECWIYEYNSETNTFKVRDEIAMPVFTEGEVNRYRAAQESNYDVLAAPWISEV